MDTPITIRRELKVGDTVRFMNQCWPKLFGIQGDIRSFHSGGATALLSTGNLFKVGNLELVEAPAPDAAEYIAAINETVPADPQEPEYTGGSVSYYRVPIENPTMEGVDPYTAECNDIIEALNMNYAEGNAFKAIWRRCAAQLGKAKKGYTDGLYDAQKVVFFGERLVAQHKAGPDAAE